MMAPLHQRMRKDERVRFYCSSPAEAGDPNIVFAEAKDGIQRISPFRAALMKFDAYVVADFV